MPRGFGSSASGKSCCCEDQDMSNWIIVSKTQIKSGKQYGKVKATIRCSKCNHQWDTTAKYIDHLQMESDL